MVVVEQGFEVCVSNRHTLLALALFRGWGKWAPSYRGCGKLTRETKYFVALQYPACSPANPNTLYLSLLSIRLYSYLFYYVNIVVMCQEQSSAPWLV